MRSFISLLLTLSLVALFGSQVEAGKGSKRMMALAIMSMLQKNQKIIVPFPIPMPIKVYEKKYDYYKEDYPMHGYGDNYGESGYGSHHGHHGHHGDLAGAHSHAHHHHSYDGHGFGAGSGVNYNYGGKSGGGGDHGALGHNGFSSFPGASHSAHPTVYAYDGKVGNEYGPEQGAGNPHHFESHGGNEYHGATENFAPNGGY